MEIIRHSCGPEYDLKVIFKHGYIKSTKIYSKADILERFLSDTIVEGFYPKDFLEKVHDSGKNLVESIERIMVYKNGKLIDGNLPPVWTNNRGYIFSSRGLEEIVDFDPSKHDTISADYHVDEKCRQMDKVLAGIDMEKLVESGAFDRGRKVILDPKTGKIQKLGKIPNFFKNLSRFFDKYSD